MRLLDKRILVVEDEAIVAMAIEDDLLDEGARITSWANHTVRGFFAGLKKRGLAVTVLERVRQVGPNKQGAKGSYSIYRIAEAG
jgi:CheY-like chemotaxis protein